MMQPPLPGLGQATDSISIREIFTQSMSLPGLGLDLQPEADIRLPTVLVLKEGSEWRFEVSFESKVEVKVQQTPSQNTSSKVSNRRTGTVRRCGAFRYRTRAAAALHLHSNESRHLYLGRLPSRG